MSKPYKVVCDTRDRLEWLAAREGYVGASDDLTPGLAKVKAGLKEPFKGNAHTFFGQLLEEPAVHGFRQWAGMQTRSLGHSGGKPRHLMMASVEHPVMACTLDGLCRIPRKKYSREKFKRYLEMDLKISDQGVIVDLMSDTRLAVLEVKTPGWWRLDKWGKTSVQCTQAGQEYVRWEGAYDSAKDLPKAYFTQVQHQLYVMGMEVAWLLAFIGGKKFVAYRIERCQKTIDKRIQACYEFQEKVDNLKGK